MLKIVLVLLTILFTLLGTLIWDVEGNKGSNRWISIGNGDTTTAWSDDGMVWTGSLDSDGIKPPFGSAGEAYTVHYANGLWVLGGLHEDTPTGKTLWWSNDGKTWEFGTGTRFGTTATSSCQVVTHAYNKWIAGGISGTSGGKKIIYSNDGKVWDDVNDNPFGTATTAACNSLDVGKGLIVAGGRGTYNLYWSVNGLDWTPAGGDPFGSDISSNVASIAHSESSWVAIGNNSDEQVWYSSNGKDWTASTSHPFGTASLWDVKYYNGIYVISGTRSSGLGYSLDEGRTWIAATGTGSLSDVNFRDIFVSDRYWFTGGLFDNDPDPAIWIGFKSEDGKSWTRDITLDGTEITGFYNSGAFGKAEKNNQVNSLAVIGGNGSTNLLYSTNGDEWTATSSSPFGSSGNVSKVRWNLIN